MPPHANLNTVFYEAVLSIYLLQLTSTKRLSLFLILEKRHFRGSKSYAFENCLDDVINYIRASEIMPLEELQV